VSKGGRGPKTFEMKGKTARHNAITNVVKAAKNSMACAALATKRLASEAGFDDAAWVFKKLAKDPVGGAKAIREALKRPEGPIVMSAEEGWAHMVLARLSKDQYKTIFKRQRRNKGKIYPDYDVIRDNKPNWMPNKADFQAKLLYTSPVVKYLLEQPAFECVFLAYLKLIKSNLALWNFLVTTKKFLISSI
jgi:hypothetical protein